MLRSTSISKKFQLLPITAAVASAFTGSSQAVAQDEGLVLEEVIVTARKRTESVQDIPASIQAISGADLKEMGARGMEDFTRFMPSVNMISYGNGSSSVIFRGATIDGGGYVAQATASVYLDEISITSTGDQPAVRMVDIAQVEALAGPQGTIYGSDAQAGTLRIITNKPVMNEFFLELDGSLRNGEDSDDSYDGSIVLNLPIVDDTLALRVVGFKSEDGGFIDNVAGHTPDTSVTGQPWDRMDWGGLDNDKYVKDDVNDSTTKGWRAALKWDVNENWSATAGYLHQEMDNGAYQFYDPNVGDLEKVSFFDDYSEDDYDLYSLTVEADLGFAQLVSATAYYERDTAWGQDITAYHHYWTGAYWSCAYAAAYALDPDTYYWYYFTPGGVQLYNGAYCLAPTATGDYLSTIQETGHQDRFTQEIRLSAQGDTIDWLVGLYYEDSKNSWESDFADVTDGDFQDSIALDYYEWLDRPDPTDRNSGEGLYPDATHAWDSYSDTTWEQYAVFGEVVWHATDKIDVTLGGRYFDRDTENEYYVQRPNTRDDLVLYPTGPDTYDTNDTEFAPKVAVSYSFTDDVMAYALYTEGYRPGGTNRIRGEPFFPSQFEPDQMNNYEMGLRSTIMNGAGRFNATVFYMDWEDYQMELVDPASPPGSCPADGPSSIPNVCGQPWQVSIGNAGDAHILGVNMEFDWAISQNFTFGMNAEWLEAENDTDLDGMGLDVKDGDDLPTVADWTGAAWLGYEQPMNYFGGSAFYARLQWSYRGESNNIIENTPADGSSANPQLENSSSDIGDLLMGVRGDSWEVSAFVNNLTDERATYQTGSGAFEWGAATSVDGRGHTEKRYVNRPREYGVRIIKRFGG
jgi:iron complex outermembrane receptor protein